MPRKFRIYLISIFILAMVTQKLSAQKIIELPETEENRESIDISPYVSIYEDKTARLGIEDIKIREGDFRENRMIRPIFGFTQSAIWVKFTIDPGKKRGHAGEEKRLMYIFFDNGLQENTDLFIPDQKKSGMYREIKAGLKAGVAYRNFFTAKVAVPIEVVAGDPFTVYVRVLTIDDIVEIPLYLQTEKGQRFFSNKQSLFHGFYYGVIIVVFLYNLFIFFSIRDRNYLLYCLNVITMGIIFTSHHGRLSYLFGDDFRLYKIVLNTLLMVSPMIALIFSRNFMQTRQKVPRADLVLRILLGLLVVYGIFASTSNHYPIQFYFVVLVTGCVTLLWIGIFLYKKYSYARIYTHAWAIYLLMLILYSLRSVNVHFPFSNYGIELGGIIQAVLLSFALADRIRYLQREQKQYSLVQRDLAMATEIQKYLFPRQITRQIGKDKKAYEIAGKYYPSSSLSGDFYDYIEDEKGNLQLIMVDVAGHGYAAGLVASMIKVAFRETLGNGEDIKKHQSEINRIIYDNVQSTFATALNIRIMPEMRRMSVVSSGHMPLLHYQAKKKALAEYKPGGLPLGVIPAYDCNQLDVSYESGDRLVIFTDGVTEELNTLGQEYGILRLREKVMMHFSMSAANFADELLADIIRWKTGRDQEDDITFVVIDLN